MKNKHQGSDFDDFLRAEGIWEEVESAAINRVIAAREEHYAVEIDDGECDLHDDAEPEYDLAAIREWARCEGREYRGLLSGRLVRLAPDVSEFFQTNEAVNDALRGVMQERRQAA